MAVEREALRWLARVVEGLAVTLALVALGVWMSIPPTASLRRLAHERPTTSRVMTAWQEEHARAPAWSWRELDTMAPHLRLAVILAEDTWFMRHAGVDWGHTVGALISNATTDRPTLGASTITQQLAKNLLLPATRSYTRKAREILLAGRLEDALTKPRILELYLNMIEWGDGVFGAEAAAQHWFGCGADALTPAQAVRLAVVLPAPRRLRPNALDAASTRRARGLIVRMHRGGRLDAAARDTALAELTPP